MIKLFTDHPHSLGESYFVHLKFACCFGFNMLFGGLSCIIHAFFPFLFKNTGSNYLFKMIHHFIERMPCDEKRICTLHACLEEKRGNHGTLHTGN